MDSEIVQDDFEDQALTNTAENISTNFDFKKKSNRWNRLKIVLKAVHLFKTNEVQQFKEQVLIFPEFFRFKLRTERN